MNKSYRQRLREIWRAPEFTPFFERFSKRGIQKIKENTVLFNEGDLLERVILIKEGFVKLYQLSSDGRETTIYLYGPGEILGVRALTSEDVCARHFAQALTDLKVLSLTRKEYFDALVEDPEGMIGLLHVFINRLNYTERKLEGFIITDSTSRVAYFLADTAKRFGLDKNGRIILPLNLTHQMIAEFVGSFRETVTLSMKELEEKGILKSDRGKITILDTKKLSREAGFVS